MKLLIRIFISVYIFLLAGSASVHAFAQQDNISYTPVKIPEQATNTFFADIQNTHVLDIKQDYGITVEINDKVDTRDNEDEDDEPLSFKKIVSAAHYSATLFNTYIPGYFCTQIKRGLPACKHIFNFPTQKLHIIFSVFRI